jgi:type IV secretory pathway TrbL component
MSHKEHKEEKKLRKLAHLLKNRRTQAINLQEETLARGRELEKEREEKVKEAGRSASSKSAFAKRQEAQPAWSARMQEIRNKNTGRARMASERWNRFAGTEEGGGRGL